MTRGWFKQISFGLGVSLFLYLLWRLGWDTLVRDFRSIGWFLAVIVALSGVKYVLSARAWAAAFFPEERQSWRKLFGYRLAGETINYVSIAGPLLGEPVKASMLRGVRFLPGLASTLLETTANSMAGILVIVTGLGLLVLRHAPERMLLYAGYLAILILLALGSGFIYLLKCRVPFLTGPWRRLRHLPWLSSPKLGENLALVEGRMHRLSAERPGALWSIFLLSFLTQALALLEIYVVILPLGITPRFSTVLVIEAFTKLAKTVFFFVPGRIGADEGSSAGVFALLGLSPAAGVTLTLARRLRAIFWSALGLVFLLANSVKPDLRQSEAEERPSSERVIQPMRSSCSAGDRAKTGPCARRASPVSSTRAVQNL